MCPPALHEDLIDIAPAPILAWFERLDDRMIGGVEVLGGVLVLRGIAATNVATDQADAQMHPAVAQFQAFFTPRRTRCHVANLIQMTALLSSHHV